MASPGDPLASSPLYRAMVAGGVDYRPWENPGLGDDACFLCDVKLDDLSRTLEDVFPMWMQRQIGSRREGPHIELPNRTLITPDRIRVPACRPCNNEHLSRIEQAVSEAFSGGPSAVAALPERTLRTWLAKLAYGIRRNDVRLSTDIRDPAAPTIASSDDLKGLATLHLLLQEARDVVRLPDGYSTVFVFGSQTVGCNVCDFDVALPIGWPHPAMIRLGNVTVIGAVDDRGALDVLRTDPAFIAAQQIELHPVQVRALWALLVHRASLMRLDRPSVRFGVSDRRLWIERDLSDRDVFDAELEQTSANTILASLVKEDKDVIEAYGGAAGLLVDTHGSPRVIPFVHGRLSLS